MPQNIEHGCGKHRTGGRILRRREAMADDFARSLIIACRGGKTHIEESLPAIQSMAVKERANRARGPCLQRMSQDGRWRMGQARYVGPPL